MGEGKDRDPAHLDLGVPGKGGGWIPWGGRGQRTENRDIHGLGFGDSGFGRASGFGLKVWNFG